MWPPSRSLPRFIYLLDSAKSRYRLAAEHHRLRAVEFTEIVVMEEFVVSYKRPDLQSDITGFIKPFAPMVWLTVLLAALVVCALTWVILRAQSKLTRKVIGGLWLLVAFVLVSVYRGNLKAMLILPKVELPFNSLQELARSDVRVWSPGNHIALQMIMAAPPDSVYGLIAQRSYTHMRIAEGVQLVYEGKHAAVTLMLAALDNMDKTFSRTSACPLYVVAERFLKTNSMGLPIRKGSELKPKLDRAITRLREFGILEHIIQKKLANGTICMKPLSHTVTAGALRPLDIVDFFGVFAIYAGENRVYVNIVGPVLCGQRLCCLGVPGTFDAHRDTVINHRDKEQSGRCTRIEGISA
nr:uncharacterized protein LOC113814549 [Penaeus vannamei]